MVLVQDKSTANLDNIAKALYTALNRQNIDLSWDRDSSIIGRIHVKMEEDLAANNYLHASFWNYLLDNDYEKLHDIITGRPVRLKQIIEEVDLLFGHDLFSMNNSYRDARLNPFGTRVVGVFNFTTLYRKKEICRLNCRQFNLVYCPYCNINTVPVIDVDPNLHGQQLQMALHQVDHFYPQSRYPYLALSFFNLIPGCSACNGQLKLELDFNIDTHFNPFHKRLDDFFKFEIDLDQIFNSQSVTIVCQNKVPHPNNAIVDFELIERYNTSHGEEIYWLYQGLKNRSKKTRRSLRAQLAGLYNDRESIRMSYVRNKGIPIDQKDINQRHLGKLKRDLCIQLGILP